ncbi:hypothetical protein [Alkalibaculum sporogenes]|uniref:hypothetical protein n=1 Tax=Alkalibaculum sporogenes TaxID=2655001 RepID=UPI00187B351F|nr:hypothetical protein [Alkalibaculum sporogenes]
MIIIGNGKDFRVEFDYEEDTYDRLKNSDINNSKDKCFTNRSTMKKIEFDYEEDHYEP